MAITSTKDELLEQEVWRELLSLCIVRFSDSGMIMSMSYPSADEIAGLLSYLRVSWSISVEDISDRLRSLAQECIPQWRQDFLRDRQKVEKRRSQGAVPLVQANTLSNLEALIRSMKSQQLGHMCVLNGLSVDPHPTNPGITAMRRKNILLGALKKGVELKV